MHGPTNSKNSNYRTGGKRKTGAREDDAVLIRAELPTFWQFVQGIADDEDGRLTVRGLRHLGVERRDDDSGYPVTVADFWIKDGVLTCRPASYAPDAATADAIAAEAAKANLPTAVVTTTGLAEKQRRALGVTEENWFEFRTLDRKRVIMCEERRPDGKGGKHVLPWTLFSDGKWRMAEPGGPRPLWKGADNKHSQGMIHEGAKPARLVDWMCNDPTREAEEARAKHPYYPYLKNFQHFGFGGGAFAASRMDFSELKHFDILVVVCDHDDPGEAVPPHIARHFRGPVYQVRFDENFPASFDLGNEIPKHLFDQDGNYTGPEIVDLLRTATWATDRIRTGKKGAPSYRLREAFRKQVVFSIVPDVFIFKNTSETMLTYDQFNAKVAAFSDVKDTAALVQKCNAAQVDGIAFDPGKPTGQLSKDRKLLWNTYRPPPIKPKKGDVSPWEDLLAHLVPNADERHHLKRWAATLIARPDIKMKHGCLLISKRQGVGKSTVGKTLVRAMGRANCSFPTESMMLESRFNGWRANKRLAVVHEIYQGDNKRAYDKLKDVIADDSFECDLKFKDSFILDNWMHVFACSNSERALYLDNDDRRWFVPRVIDQLLPPEFWVKYNHWLDTDGPAVLHWWAREFLKTNEPIHPGEHAPSSGMKRDLIYQSMSEGKQIAFDVAQEIVANGQPTVIIIDDLRNYIATVRGMDGNDKRLESNRTLINVLREAGLKSPALDYTGQVRRYTIKHRNKAVVATHELTENTWEDIQAKIDGGTYVRWRSPKDVAM